MRYSLLQRLIHWTVAVIALGVLAVGFTLGILGFDGVKDSFGISRADVQGIPGHVWDWYDRDLDFDMFEAEAADEEDGDQFLPGKKQVFRVFSASAVKVTVRNSST